MFGRTRILRQHVSTRCLAILKWLRQQIFSFLKNVEVCTLVNSSTTPPRQSIQRADFSHFIPSTVASDTSASQDSLIKWRALLLTTIGKNSLLVLRPKIIKSQRAISGVCVGKTWQIGCSFLVLHKKKQQ